MLRFSEPVLSVARGHACPHGIVIGTTGFGFRHAPLHRQQLVVVLKGRSFLVELGRGVVDVTGAGGQEHRQPVRRAHVGLVCHRPLARRARPGHVRGEGGAEGGSGADEDERAENQMTCLLVI